MNTVGNIFSGQVVGETAKTLSERFGKVLQKRQSITINMQMELSPIVMSSFVVQLQVPI